MLPAFDPKPITLSGRFVRLEPLAMQHAPDLLLVGGEETIWRYMPNPPLRTVEEAAAWIGSACLEVSAGRQVAFAIVDAQTQRAVGSTRFLSLRREHRGLEIGYTWLAQAARRTPVNTECKLLLLSHAFDTLKALRVEFKTDARNERSQRALERIGAVREGVFRRHMLMWDGHVRDSVYYSIVDNEWPATKALLMEKLRDQRGAGEVLQPGAA